MADTITLRLATPADLAAVDALLARAYPRLLAADYPPSVLVIAVPLIARARPELLASGRYWLACDSAGTVLAAGGWSRGAPSDGAQRAGTFHDIAGLFDALAKADFAEHFEQRAFRHGHEWSDACLR